MESVVGKLVSEIGILEDRVKAKEAILKCVFASLENSASERQMIRRMCGVTTKVSCTPCLVSLKQNWCVGFEDTICVSFSATNTSKDYQMQAVCHVPISRSVTKCIIIDKNGLCIPFIRLNSGAELLVGFPKSQFFNSTSCSILLEFIHVPSTEKYSDCNFLISLVSTRQCLPVETHGVEIKVPKTWYSLTDFMSAKEHDMRFLLRCLRLSCYVYPLKPLPSFGFADANPDFYCCDFGEWQVFVGHKLKRGLIATSSSFDQPNACIDRIHGFSTELLDAFVNGSNDQVTGQ